MSTAKAYSAGDGLVEKHLDLVKRIAHHLVGRLPAVVQIEDLMQAGAMGLIEASRHYDAKHGASFETYAGIRIRGAMLDEVRRLNWSPRSAHRNMRRIGNAIRAVEARVGRNATGSEVAEEMGLDLDSYHELLRRATEAQVFNADDILGPEANNGDGFESDVGDPASDYEDLSMGEAIGTAIDELPEREKTVMALYYDEELNLREIGEVLGVTESRICQIHGQALARLRARLTEWNREGGDDQAE